VAWRQAKGSSLRNARYQYSSDLFQIEFFGVNRANAGNYFEGTKCYKEISKGCKEEVPERDGKQRTASAVLATNLNTQQRNKCFQFSALARNAHW
jgi:hypothetical protein